MALDTMILEQAIRLHMASDAMLMALMDSSAIYMSDSPQADSATKKFPQILVQEISGVSEETHAGFAGVERRRFQFTIRASCLLECLRIRFRLEKLFNSRAVWLGGQPDGVYCGRIAKVNQSDLGREPGERIHRYVTDYMFWERRLG